MTQGSQTHGVLDPQSFPFRKLKKKEKETNVHLGGPMRQGQGEKRRTAVCQHKSRSPQANPAAVHRPPVTCCWTVTPPCCDRINV